MNSTVTLDKARMIVFAVASQAGYLYTKTVRIGTCKQLKTLIFMGRG